MGATLLVFHEGLHHFIMFLFTDIAVTCDGSDGQVVIVTL